MHVCDHSQRLICFADHAAVVRVGLCARRTIALAAGRTVAARASATRTIGSSSSSSSSSVYEDDADADEALLGATNVNGGAAVRVLTRVSEADKMARGRARQPFPWTLQASLLLFFVVALPLFIVAVLLLPSSWQAFTPKASATFARHAAADPALFVWWSATPGALTCRAPRRPATPSPKNA